MWYNFAMSKGQNYFGQNDIRPSFSPNKKTEDKDTKDSSYYKSQTKNSRATSAKKSLKNLENSAISKTSGRNFSENAHTIEKTSTSASFYTGSGKKSKKSLKNLNLKKTGPITGILVAFLASIIFLFVTNSMQPFQLSSLITEATDTSYTSYTLRSRSIIKQTLAGKRGSLSDYMKARFEKQNIKVSSAGSGYEFDYNGTKVNADNFDDIIAHDTSFRDAFNKAKRGRGANFYDTSSESIFQKLGTKLRNLFSGFTQTGENNKDTANFKNTMTDYFEGGSNTRINTAEDRPVDEDGDGEADGKKRVRTGEDVDSNNIDGADATTKARSYLASVSQKVATAGGLGCAVLKVGNMIAVAIAANEIYQSIHYFLTNTGEPISKTIAGNGNDSPINQTMNTFNTPVTTTITDPATNTEKEVTGAPAEAEGIKKMLGNETVDQSKTRSYSVEKAFQSTAAAITTNGLSTAACSAVQTGGAIISLATLAFPGGGFIKATVGLLLDTVIATGIQIGVTAILGAMIPMIAKTMFTNAFENAAGLEAGELIAKGASATNTRLARSGSGQAPSSATAALGYARESEVILAQEAAEKRLNKSPFDASSPDTFLGTILSKFSTITGPTTAILSSIGSFNNLTSRSIASLSPTYAAGEGATYMTTFGNYCDKLTSIGAKGDIYCNPVTSGDVSTSNLNRDTDGEYQAILAPNLETDEEGNEKVKDNSELANYIIYCTERNSPFGIVDANIANAFQSSLGIVGDNIPVLNDVIDIVNAAENVAALPWATGEICVNSEENPRWDSEFKYYAAYIEENRILEQMEDPENLSYVNPVLAFKDHYATEHPQDESPAGLLSTITGLTKDDAETTIAVMYYLAYLNDYPTPELRADTSVGTSDNIGADAIFGGGAELTSELERGSPVTTGRADASAENILKPIFAIRREGLVA